MSAWREHRWSWRSVGLALLVLFAGAQLAAVQLLFHRYFQATVDVLLLDIACLGALVVIVGITVSLLPNSRRGTWGAVTLATLTFGTLHWLLTMFAALSLVTARIAHIPPPLLLILTEPLFTLSLLASAGISPAKALAVPLALLALHLAAHALVAGRTVAVLRWVGRDPLLLRGRRVPVAGLALVYLAATALLWLSIDRQRMKLEPLTRSLQDTVRAAPSSLGSVGAPARAQPGPPLPRPRPVILIIVDALRPDRMGVYNHALDTTPFLSGLRATGALQRIDRAYGGCSFSLCGIIGILTSRTWDDFGIWPQTIMDVLAGHRYRNYLVLSGNHAQFGNLQRLYGPNITALSGETLTGAGPHDDDRAVLRRLEATRFPDPASSFVYLHLMSAHTGSHLLPQFRPRGANGTPAALDASLRAPRPPRYYDLGVRQTDLMIRGIFRVLERKGMLDDALVVITADHGERLGEDGRFMHGGQADERILAVPLLVYDRRAVYPVRPIASLLDVAPTLLAGVGAPVPRTMTGIPLQQATQRRAIPFGTNETTGALVRLDDRTYRFGCDRDTGRIDVRRFETSTLDGRIVPDVQGTRALYDRLRLAFRGLPRALPVDLAPC